jgi:RNA polymerase sigma-70 factor (ECF subfamily)
MSNFRYEGVDPAIDPEGEAEQKEVLRALSHCFQELSLPDQQVFMMRAVREESYQDITKILNLPQGTVASKYNRAKEKIKECLKKQGIQGNF